MPSRKELVAFGRNDSEIAQEIGADAVIFQGLEDLVECVKGFNGNITGFDVSVFSGCYLTGYDLFFKKFDISDIDNTYLESLEVGRGDRKVKADHGDTDVIGLYNSYEQKE